MRRTRFFTWLFGALALAALMFFLPRVQLDVSRAAQPSAAPFWHESETPASPARPPLGAPASFAELAARVKPAIVNVNASRPAHRRRGELRPFFGRRFPFGGLGDDEDERREVPMVEGEGTGFVISSDGYIITNHHVIDDAEEVRVYFDDEREFEASVVGADTNTDVALLKIEPDAALHALPLGDSDAMRVGDWVLAVGNAVGLSNTVTAGIVSAKNRVIHPGGQKRRFDDFIQTDAAINNGNSGGPLLNLAGEVIGINTAVRPFASSIGFAVPINIAKQILPQLRSTGRVSRGWLGIAMQEIDDDMARALELADARGVLISQVLPDSPAEGAGLQSGDVVVAFDGAPIAAGKDLQQRVGGAPGGSTVTLRVLRDGREREFSVTLGELDEETQAPLRAGRTRPPRAASESNAFGFAVRELSPARAAELKRHGRGGVEIADIEAESAAAKAGLREGDVVLEVNREPVPSVEEFEDALGRRNKLALLLVRRGRSELFYTLKK